MPLAGGVIQQPQETPEPLFQESVSPTALGWQQKVTSSPLSLGSVIPAAVQDLPWHAGNSILKKLARGCLGKDHMQETKESNWF